jgi:hypothetical protein
MALITNSLSVWDISFRWAGFDPDRIFFRLPLLVKDNFRVLMEAILSGEILCETLTLAKRPSKSKADPNYYIRTHIDDVYACMWGKKYNRKLLKWAVIERYSFKEWCERRGIPLPEFWFPPGWEDDFKRPEAGTLAILASHQEPEQEGGFSIRYKHPLSEDDNSEAITEPLLDDRPSLRQNQLRRIACQQIALEIWGNDISRTIPSIVEDEVIQNYGGGRYYNKDTVKGWIKVVAPPEVKSRRGRPPKKRV